VNRKYHTAVWIGIGTAVWGGWNSVLPSGHFSDGALYSP
jgi:hypothetical protein